MVQGERRRPAATTKMVVIIIAMLVVVSVVVVLAARVGVRGGGVAATAAAAAATDAVLDIYVRSRRQQASKVGQPPGRGAGHTLVERLRRRRVEGQVLRSQVEQAGEPGRRERVQRKVFP